MLDYIVNMFKTYNFLETAIATVLIVSVIFGLYSVIAPIDKNKDIGIEFVSKPFKITRLDSAKKACREKYNGELPSFKVINYLVEKKELSTVYHYAWNFDFIKENKARTMNDNLDSGTLVSNVDKVAVNADIIALNASNAFVELAKDRNIFYDPILKIKGFDTVAPHIDKSRYVAVCIRYTKEVN